MEIDGSEMEFGELAHAVHRALIESQMPKRLEAAFRPPTNEPPDMPTMPKRLSRISVSPWMMDELRYRRHHASGPDMIMVDYCDGKGPRVRWFGIICDYDDSLTRHTVRLS